MITVEASLLQLLHQDDDNGGLPLVVLLSLVIFISVSMVLVLLQMIKQMKTKKPFDELPMPPNSHWLLGHAKIMYGEDFPSSIYQMQKESANQHGQTGYWLINKATISVLDLQDARTILLKESYRTSVPIVTHFIHHVIGRKALILMNGREWKLHRDAITRTFVPTFLQEVQTQIQQVAQDLVATLHEKIDESDAPVKQWQGNIQPICKHATMDVFGKAAFGIDFDGCKTLQASPLVEAFEYLCSDLTERMKNPVLPWNYYFDWPTTKNRIQREKFMYLRNFIQQLLSQQHHQEGVDSPIKNNSLLTRLVAAHAENNCSDGEGGKNNNHHSSDDPALDEALKDVMSTLLFAGYDTTSTTLMFALYLLAQHPDIQDRCWEEVQQLGDDNDATDSLRNPNKLQYTAAVIKETLRLYPSGFQTSRTLSKPIPLKGRYVAPKGAHIGIPIWIIQRDATIFPHPDECHPERWVKMATNENNDNGTWVERSYKEEESAASGTTGSASEPTATTTTNKKEIKAGNPDAMLVFSLGGRSCPGSKFAFQEAVLLLANLIKDLKVKPVPDFKLKMKIEGVLPAPVNGIPLRIEKRG